MRCFILNALICSILLLTACQRTCDEACPRNAAHNTYVMKYKKFECQDVPDQPDFQIPTQYATSCRSCPNESIFGSESATLYVSYPDFQPAKAFLKSKSLQDGEIYIRIESACFNKTTAAQNLTNEPHNRPDNWFLSRIEKNKESKDRNNNPQFAEIEQLDSGIYIQKNIGEPRAPGNASYYFHKNENGEIISLFSCDQTNRCSSEKFLSTDDSSYSIRYRFQGIDYREFQFFDQRIQDFVNNLYENPPSEKIKKTRLNFNH